MEASWALSSSATFVVGIVLRTLPTFTFMFSDALMLKFFVLTFTSLAEDMVMVPFNSSMKILLAQVVL